MADTYAFFICRQLILIKKVSHHSLLTPKFINVKVQICLTVTMPTDKLGVKELNDWAVIFFSENKETLELFGVNSHQQLVDKILKKSSSQKTVC